MKNLKQAQRALFWFGLFKIPIIRFVRPKVVKIDAGQCVIRIPYRRRNKNHLGGIYIAAFTIGADLAAGFLAFYLFRRQKLRVSLAFKSMEAQYHKRAEADLFFICKSGKEIAEMIEESKTTGERQNKVLPIYAQLASSDEPIASINIELSIKVK